VILFGSDMFKNTLWDQGGESIVLDYPLLPTKVQSVRATDGTVRAENK